MSPLWLHIDTAILAVVSSSIKPLVVTCLGFHRLLHLPCANVTKWLHNTVHSWCLVSSVSGPLPRKGSKSHSVGQELHCKHCIVLFQHYWMFAFVNISNVADIHLSFKDVKTLYRNLVMERISSITVLHYSTSALSPLMSITVLYA